MLSRSHGPVTLVVAPTCQAFRLLGLGSYVVEPEAFLTRVTRLLAQGEPVNELPAASAYVLAGWAERTRERTDYLPAESSDGILLAMKRSRVRHHGTARLRLLVQDAPTYRARAKLSIEDTTAFELAKPTHVLCLVHALPRDCPPPPQTLVHCLTREPDVLRNAVIFGRTWVPVFNDVLPARDVG